jgi:UDP-N-acetylmuramoylalanine--D-glutamate ligase
MTAPGRSLVYGFRVMGQSISRALVQRGLEVVAVDDHPSTEGRAQAVLLDVHLVEAPDLSTLRSLVADVDAVLPSPGLPDEHPLFSVATELQRPVLSEYDLAREWDPRPVVAVTGTDGKTTVTTLVRDMLELSGVNAVACGNNDLPLVDAIDQIDPDVFVVEASSFQLGHTLRVEPKVAVWLNFAPDHLDVHASLDAYESAKARVWENLPAGGVAVANADDPVVMRNLPPSGSAQVVTFGSDGDYRVVDGELLGPEACSLIAVEELPRSMPHDVGNALASAAGAIAAGATVAGVRQALLAFRGLPHRVELVGEWGDVAWYDDSKATVPHATRAALQGFDRVVLIAGGRNKGLVLDPLADDVGRLRAVVAIGEAAPSVAAVFEGRCPVRVVDTTMADAVEAAAQLARPGDVVLLSPGCASFDWFDSYRQRGAAFQHAVRQRIGGERTGVGE